MTAKDDALSMLGKLGIKAEIDGAILKMDRAGVLGSFSSVYFVDVAYPDLPVVMRARVLSAGIAEIEIDGRLYILRPARERLMPIPDDV